MNKSKHPVSIAAAIAAVAAVTAAIASAAPINAPNTATITLICPSGSVTGVVTLVRGEFTPAHAAGSNTVFIPTGFGEFTGIATDTDGNVLFTVDELPLAKENAVPQNSRLITCTGVITTTVPGGHFSGSSTVTGFVARPLESHVPVRVGRTAATHASRSHRRAARRSRIGSVVDAAVVVRAAQDNRGITRIDSHRQLILPSARARTLPQRGVVVRCPSRERYALT